MILSELFTQINGTYRGTDDDAPTTGPDFNLWLATANRKQAEWGRDTKQTWRSLFSIYSLPTVIATAVQTYDLSATILLPADKITITTLTNTVVDYKVAEPQERDRYEHSVYISGNNPQKITFNDTIKATDVIVGGTINVAGYFLPADLTEAGNTIQVDDPYWLVYAVASELAFNDLTYESKYVDLNAKANNLYSQMAQNNRRGSNNSPRQARVNINRIIDPRSEVGYGN